MQKTINLSLLLSIGLLLAGCAEPDASPGRKKPLPLAQTAIENPIAAKVNGQPITKNQLVDTLYAGRGRTVLDEMVLLEIARQESQKRGLPTGSEITIQELNRVLNDMAPNKARRDQLALLNYMLQRRGLTRSEFDIILEKQGLLRQMVSGETVITDKMIAAEYQRLYGPKVQVRQIVVGTLPRMVEIQQRLTAGEPFGKIAVELSEDETTAKTGGLMEPFSIAHEDVPLAVRQAAEQLKQPGDRSEPVHYVQSNQQERWALLQLENILPASQMPLDSVREQIKETLRQRDITARMLELQQKLRHKAQVDIIDPDLRQHADLPDMK